MAKAKKYWAARNFGYGDIETLDLGQVVELLGVRNDESLVRLGHFREVQPFETPVQCGKCEGWFVNEGYLNRHGRGRHGRPTGNPELSRLQALEEQDKFAEKNLPLNLDKTKASAAAGV